MEPKLEDLPERMRLKIQVDADDADSCWRWIGAMTADGNPSVRVGPRILSARRVVWQLLGRADQGRPLYPTCDTRCCVRPGHTVPMSNGQIWKRTNRFNPELHSARVSMGLRRSGRIRISDEAVRDIVFGDQSAKEASAKHNVALSYVYRLRQGTNRRDVTAGPLRMLSPVRPCNRSRP